MGRQLAYTAHDGDESCEVVFADRAATARNRAAAHWEMDPDEVEVSRSKWADSYAPGPVPDLVLIEHGWWMECTGCGLRINGEGEAWDDDDNLIKLDPVEHDRHGLYCTPKCRDHDIDRMRRRNIAQAALIVGLREQLLTLYPTVIIVGDGHAYVQERDGMWEMHQGIIDFRFPGCVIGNAQFRFDKLGEPPAVWVCGGDRAAWEAWRDARNA